MKVTNMTFSKSVKYCGRNGLICVSAEGKRRFTTGGLNTLEPQKMQHTAKSIVINQWKLMNTLKNYLAKFSNDITYEEVLNKEFAKFLQKVPPSVYSSSLIQYLQQFTTRSFELKSKASKKEQMGTSLPNILSGLIFKTDNKVQENTKEVVPKWKVLKPTMSKEAISSRTTHLISSILSSESQENVISKVQEFCAHIKQYPEAKHDAVKKGAIRYLLKLRHYEYSDNKPMESVLSDALVLLGHADPLPGYGIRILSIDGGGVRGILVIEMLRRIEALIGKPIHETFDLVCGVSTGAILASLISMKQKTLDEIEDIYTNISSKVFTRSTLKGTSNLVWSHSYYDTALWERSLQDELGQEALIDNRRNFKCPKFCAVSAVVNHEHLSAYVFRNYNLPCNVQSQYWGGSDHKVWQAVRASAAAPTYFEEFKLGNMLHQDGGILANNPTAVAIHEAKLIWPNTPVQCIVSCGTGRTVPTLMDLTKTPESVVTSSWTTKIRSLIESATDTEGVHMMLSDLLPAKTYFRFNPYLTEMLNMAEIDPDKIAQLKRDAVMYLSRNEDKFQEAASLLNLSKSVTQKLIDWISLKSEMHNLYVAKY